MKFILNNFFLICIILGCSFLLILPKLQRRGPHIPPFQVAKKMNEGKVVFIDVSKQSEYEENHIRGAVHIPIGELEDRLARIERFKGDTIVVVCPKGSVAPKATAVLKKAGFDDVSSMEGGMKDWKDQNMPYVTSAAEEADEATNLPKRMKKKKGKARA